MNDLMRRINENVGFGSSTVQQGAEEFIAQADATLRRA
jgi:multiple sugar transport system substrate-binding protein